MRSIVLGGGGEMVVTRVLWLEAKERYWREELKSRGRIEKLVL